MECKKWNGKKNRNNYLEFCKNAIEDENIFNQIKNRVEYNMVEKPGIEYKKIGDWLLNIYIKEYKHLLKYLETGINNDKYLKPVKFDYEYLLKDKVELSTYKLSYCCISYTIKAINILKHIQSLKLDKVNIIEIGGGYGGQSFILHNLCINFNIKIESYTIIDLEYPSKIQNKYIELLNIPNTQSFYNIENIDTSKFNFFISNYALSEISTKIQNKYIDNLLKNIKHGFLLWNFLNKEEMNPYFKKKGKHIREKCNPQTSKNSIEIKY